MIPSNFPGAVRCLALCLAIVTSTLPATATSITWNGGTGSWSSPGNWTPSQVPGPGDDATVGSGGYVTLDADISVQTLNLLSAGVTGEAVFHGVLNCFGGGGNGDFNAVTLTIAHGSQLNLLGNADKLFVVGVITNHGVLTWTNAGSFKFGFNNAYLRNEADGEFRIQSTGFLGGNPVSDNNGAYIYNSGLLTCDVGPVTNMVSVGRGTFVNNGQLRLLSGSLVFTDGLVSTGSGNEIFVAGTSGLEVSAGGRPTQFTDTVFSGTGVHRLKSGDVTMTGGIQATNVVLAGSTLRGNAAAGGQTLVGGLLEWQGGELTDLALTIAPGAELDLTGAALKYGGGASLTNHGKIVWTGTGHFKGSMKIVNATDGEFLVQSTGYLGSAPEGENFFDRFENHGLWICDVGAGNQSYESAGHYTFPNTGRIEVRSGTLLLDAPFDSSGPGNELWVAAGATLLMPGNDPSTFTDTVFSGPGLHQFYKVGGYGTGPVSFNGNIVCTNVVVNGSQLISSTGPATLHGTLDWKSGETADLNLTVAPDGEVDLSGAGEWNLNRGSITNHGLINWPGPGNFRLNGAANFVNETNGVFLVQSTGFLGGNPAVDNNSAFIVNRGTWISDTGSGTNVVAVAFQPFVNTGTLEVRSGTMQVAANANKGGSFDLPLGSVLRVDLGGTTPGTGFGRLQVTGKLTLGGELQLVSTNGFQPQPSDNFPFLSATTTSGEFSSVLGAPVNGGLFLEPVYANGGVSLHVRDNSANLVALPGKVDHGEFSLRLEGAISQTYDLYYTHDFSGWTFLRRVTLVTPTLTVTDTTVGAETSRFYRATIANPLID